MAAVAARPDPPVDLAEGRLWLLGSLTEADAGRISWLSPSARGFEPINAYLIVEPDRALLVDSGVSAHADALVEQLRQVIDESMPLSVFVTRMEGDCTGGLRGLPGNFNLTHVYSGGLINPFDFFDDVATQMTLEEDTGLITERVHHGGTLQLTPSRPCLVLRALLRLLSTSWLYDPATETMFTSDAFSHVRVPAGDGGRAISMGDDVTTLDGVAEHLTTKFDWLAYAADPSIIADDLAAIFAEHSIRRIAPTRGAVIEGAPAVERHLALVTEAILAAPSRIEEIESGRRT